MIDICSLSSLFTKKQDINMKQETENKLYTDKHLLYKLSVGAMLVALATNGQVYGKVGLKVLTYRTITN